MGIALDRSKWRSVISPKIAIIFLSLTPFGLGNIDPRSPKLLTLKFTGVPFHLPSLVTLALTETEIAGRGRGRGILNGISDVWNGPFQVWDGPFQA